MKYNPDTSTWKLPCYDEEAVALFEQLFSFWRQVAEEACTKEELTDYEQFCVAFAAGCPVRLAKGSSLAVMEWEAAPHFLEREEGGWRCYWREFPDT